MDDVTGEVVIRATPKFAKGRSPSDKENGVSGTTMRMTSSMSPSRSTSSYRSARGTSC